jgi:hypothetical protein
VEDEVSVLRRVVAIAAGGSAMLSNWLAFILFLPVMSVLGAGVGGKLGRGIIALWLDLLLISPEVAFYHPVQKTGPKRRRENEEKRKKRSFGVS